MTGDVRLREVTGSDLPIFFEHQLDPEASRMAAFPPRDRDAFMAHWTKIMADDSAILRTVVLDGQVAGNLVSWERDARRVLGYWIGREYWGRGVATKALFEFLRQTEQRPVYAHVAKHNVASIRVLAKCGFTDSGEEVAPSDDDDVEELLMELRA